MSGKTTIEWTEVTWNPVTGCSKISPGCTHCYAERLAFRLKAMGNPNYKNGFEVTLHEHSLGYPLKLKAPRTIFVNSMSDLFHEEVPLSYIQRVFDIMTNAKQHRFQVLTKRSERLLKLCKELPWADNIWMGVSVESNDYLYRIEHLRETEAKVKFLSLEPLLGFIPELPLNGIHWVIVGGESGPGARVLQPNWVRQVRDKSFKAQVPFFFKQWGGFNKKKAGKVLDGQVWNQMPKNLLGID
jgi:protein gp37